MVFVTGGTGFIGGHLLAELAKNDVPVKALKRAKSSTLNTEKLFLYKYGTEGKNLFSKINWVDGDILDIYSLEEAMDGAREVYHCAANVSLSDDNADEIIQTAEKGTENIVNASLTKKIEKFCHVSSVAALGMPVNGTEITEECFEYFSFDNAPYAIGKHLAEAEVWRAHAEGLNVVVVSPSIVLGPWPDLQNGGMGLFSFVNRTSRFYTSGIMGFVDVKDVVGSMLRLMNENCFNERYLLSANSISFRDLYTWIAEGLKKPKPKTNLNRSALKVFQLLFNMGGSKNKISNMMIDHATSVHIYSKKKITEALKGYTFVPVKETIEQTASFFLNEVRK